jgi:ATP-dependent RNA helicase RhlE
LSGFSELNLRPELLRAIEEQGYTEPTPIQVQAIPLVLAGRDVLGGAQTGTGKTAGFGLPLLQRLMPHANSSASPARHPVRALILAPTRELAAQVEESLRGYAKYTNLRTTVIFGGMNMDPQTEALRRGVEVLVATPGRLLDHVQQKTLNLSQVEVLVLDEADRMLDMGFIPDVTRIIKLLPAKRQGLLFSATFSDEIRRLSDTFLSNPVMVQVARRNATAESVKHVAIPVAREKKRELLCYLVQTRDLKQVLVFTATRLGANRLAYQLNRDGVHATAIHGDKSQPERLVALNEFKEGKVRVLVATDVAARGLDIEDLPHVINFDLPNSPEDYVHRIGRTGRAGATGEAISLVSPEEHERLEAIEKTIRLTIPREIITGYGMDSRTVSSLLPHAGPADSRRERGGDALSGSKRERPRERERERPRSAPAQSPRRTSAPSDPIFLEPYRPGAMQSSAPTNPVAVPRPASAKPQAQVAALLGGMRFKSK